MFGDFLNIFDIFKITFFIETKNASKQNSCGIEFYTSILNFRTLMPIMKNFEIYAESPFKSYLKSNIGANRYVIKMRYS